MLETMLLGRFLADTLPVSKARGAERQSREKTYLVLGRINMSEVQAPKAAREEVLILIHSDAENENFEAQVRLYRRLAGLPIKD
jgi:hypothetical protein